MIKKIFLVSLLFTLLIFLSANFSLAKKLEVSYPGPEAPVSTKTFLPDYVRYIFNFSIMIAGLIAFGALVYGGIRYLTSAGSPTAISDAKEQIFAAIIGLIILLSSYLILTTINPQLVIWELKAPSTAKGVILYNKLGCPGKEDPTGKPGEDYLRVGVSDPDLEEFTDQIYSIYLYQSGEDLEATIYPEKNYEESPGLPAIKISQGRKAKECIEYERAGSYAGSIELDYKNPGVYLCKTGKEGGKLQCKGPYLADTDALPDFDNQATHIKFKNPKGLTYGAVVHENRRGEGKAEVFISTQEEAEQAFFISPMLAHKVSSITVFRPAKEIFGEGVTFYENVDYNQADPGGQKTLPAGNYPDFGKITYENKAKNINSDISSLKIDGNYIAVLCRHKNYGGICEVFDRDDPNLNVQNHIGNDSVSSAKIISARK